ncbi:N,N-dimethylformamidase beta subunit family domain-containing protein [Thermocatellispora tengchongensis]|uniref:N,N-dimethylformamidase beta subunit family domain-containing protein n=1 Tax=Thermocatellispora tengchongensis TaxID=1073253 RepID=UPI003632A094
MEAENREQGSAGWDIDGAGDPGIQGFATAMSVEQGGTLDLKIHSGGAPFDVAIYRLGYYNGAGARLIDTVTGTPTTQPTGTIDPTTLMASCASWTVSASWTVPPDACPGVYLARPVLGGGGASHIPFVVRNPARKAPILVVTSDSTWQAYNHAGANPADPFNGRSLYGAGTAASFVFNLSQRCRAVSYDRPWVTREHLPQTWLFNSEYPAIRWLERNGYDVDYASCPDIDADPSLLTGRQIVIVHGHSEYWSATMWDNLVAARDAGVHLIIAAGNELFWRIRWDGGRRTYACWKDSMDGQLNPTGLYSGTWQDTRAFNPQRRSPATVTGQFFRVNGLHEFALTVPDAYAAHPIWRDTTVAELGPGESRSYPGLIGFETDEDREQERPPGWVRLSETTFTVTNLISNENGNDYSGSGTVTHHMGAYQAPSGAVVLGVGTVQLAWGLDAWHDRTVRPAQPDIQQMVMNLLADMGVQCPDASRQVDLVKPVPVDFSEYGFGSAPAAATLHGGGLMSAVGIKSVTMTARLSGGALAAAAATPGPSLTMTAAMAGGGILAARGTPGAPVAGPARLRSSAAPVATLRGSDS